MSLVFEAIYTEGLAQISYLVGDDKAGLAAVIDPRRDVAVYIEMAQRYSVRITHVIETHIHADFVSGAHELKSRTRAPIWGGPGSGYGFSIHRAAEDEVIELGSIRLRMMRTPGHTPEHISILLYDERQGDEPFAVFTGDTLFNLDVGRPDLLGDGTEQDLARQLHSSLFRKLLPLGDRMEVYPGHGAGSACGKAIGDRRQSTIGNERLFNKALQPREQEEFAEWLLADMPEPPRHYHRLKKLNAQGAAIKGSPPVVPPIPAPELHDMARREEALIIDARSMLAFGGGHIPGAINIGLQAEFPNWAGWMIEPDRQILLVAESEREASTVAKHLFRLGYDHVAGFLHRGMAAWQNLGLPLRRMPEWTVHDLNQRRDRPDVIVLDVRSDREFSKGHVPGARHAFVPHLEDRLGELDRAKTIATYCGSGYRASIAASILKRHGFKDVVNVPGSWQAWRTAGLPIEDGA